MKEFRTSCIVPAPITTCYAVLCDFERYGDWSASHLRVEREGQRLRLHLRPSAPSKKAMVLPARIRVERPPSELAWGGGIEFAPWILDIHHFFELRPRGQETQFVHGERFSGVLGHLLAWWRAPELLSRYQKFNTSFARRCRELQAGF